MKKLLLSFLLLALILPVFGQQNVDEFKFSLVPRRVSVPSLTGYLKADGTVPLTADWPMGVFNLTQAGWHGQTIAVDHGGTGLTSYAIGDILYATGTTTIGKLAAVAAGQVFTSAGTTTAPAWSPSVTLGDSAGVAGGTLTLNPTLGANLLTNGDFASDPTGTNTPWMEGTSTNIGTAWAYSNGKIRHATASATTLRQIISATIGQLLRVTYTIAQDGATPIAGTLKAYVGQSTTSGAGAGRTITVAAGTYVQDIYAAGTGTYYLTLTPSTTFAATIDDISVQLVTNGIVTSNGINLNGGRILLPTGDANYPSLSFSLFTTDGIYNNGASSGIYISTAGVPRALFSSALYIYTDILLGADLNSDIRLIGSLETLQLGPDAAAPVAVTLKGPDTSQADTAGGDIYLHGGTSKGSAAGGAFYLGTTTSGAASASDNTYIERVKISDTGTNFLGANSQSTNIPKPATVLLTLTNDTHTHATALIPAGCMVVGVSCRNISAVTGDATITGYDVGISTDANAWGDNVSPLINEITDLTDCTITAPLIFAAATDVILTYRGSGTNFTAGSTVRVTVHYVSVTAPTT